ncbi:DIS3-like exonuclease 2-like [Homarus americanus]|uniref:DIS3-like exonuclease 2 n=1 Tax=Homarus americanus TaxID=6706 RepID=A0A8J5J474_HOMAM|nr:DIS3-like exonuclease 2-like [Homarus americanus]
MANIELHNSSSSSRRTTPPRQTPPWQNPSRNSGCGTPTGANTPRHMSAKKSLPVFNSYMSLFQVQEKLKKGEVIEDGGMDIYIGGVLDRNAALQGDVVAVEINPLDQWKVLYDILDEYLDDHGEEKNIVYTSLESTITASVANTASSYNNPLSINTNVGHSGKKKEKGDGTNTQTVVKVEGGHLEQCESDVVVEEEEEEDLEPKDSTEGIKEKNKIRKKRRGGRGKKGRRKLDGGEFGAKTWLDAHETRTQVKTAVPALLDVEEEQELACDTTELVIHLQEKPVEVADEILLLPTRQDLSSFHQCESDADDHSAVVIVPPDQLSECEFTDDESGCSEILDYDRAREDQSFIQAQWEAFQKEQEQEKKQRETERGDGPPGMGAVSVVTVKSEQLDPRLGTGDDKIKKITDLDMLGFLKEGSECVDTKFSDSNPVKEGEEVLSANVVNSVIKGDQNISNSREGVNITLKTESLQGDGTNLSEKKKLPTTREDKLTPTAESEDQEIAVGLEQMKLKNECNSTVLDCKPTQSCDFKKSSVGRKGKSCVSDRLLSSLPKVTSPGKSTNTSETGPISIVSPNPVLGRQNEDCRDYPEHNYDVNSYCESPDKYNDNLGIQPWSGKTNPEPTSYNSHNKNLVAKKQEGAQGFKQKFKSRSMTGQLSASKDRKEPTVLQVQRLNNWDKFVQRTAHVVHILERKHTQMSAGTLKLFGDKNPNFAFFMPTDHRVPRMKVPMRQCPPDFYARHQDYQRRIFLCKIAQWREPKFALGELVRDVGAAGDVEAETEAMLLEHGIDYAEFPDTVLQDLPSLPWSIPLQEIKARTDLRDECIFTIDPSTARDLDDAVSCLPLPSGNYRVGVHIADVSYFIPEGSQLDEIASDRATSVYLTQKVIPMLPRVLCEHLCSLNPGEDRLAFSVIWELRPNGEVVGEWFGRTVIRSCLKLAYEHAQGMIENPDKEWSSEEIPKITGPYTCRDISKVVNNLQSIAVKLRKKRFQDGALRLDQVKIAFNLDDETKAPNGFYVNEMKDSNRLIEEFMLLANMAVAHKIFNSCPKLAVLRRHPPPLENPMEWAANNLRAVNVCLDISSAGALNKSIAQYVGNDKYSIGRLQVITSMCSKPMQFARYFCSGYLSEEPLFKHYALNVPLYTHFTSPIRRYADLMVHRVLAVAVDPARYSPPARDSGTIHRISEHCNDKKQSSKILQELSSELYLSLFIRQVKDLVEEGMVTMVLDRAFDVLVLELGIIKRVYTDKLPLDSLQHTKESGVGALTLTWKATNDKIQIRQEINLFSLVRVSLQPLENDALKFQAVLLRPS